MSKHWGLEVLQRPHPVATSGAQIMCPKIRDGNGYDPQKRMRIPIVPDVCAQYLHLLLAK
jgi:hypothetical protein